MTTPERRRLLANEWVIDLEGGEERRRRDIHIGDAWVGPRISECTGNGEALGTDPKVVTDLDRPLFMEVWRGV